MQELRRAISDGLHRPLDAKTLFFCFSILVLNLLDAFATLHHLAYGAEEQNPIMLSVLHCGALPFVLFKHLLASVGVIGIALYPRQRAAHLALAILFPIYLALATYQICLFYAM